LFDGLYETLLAVHLTIKPLNNFVLLIILIYGVLEIRNARLKRRAAYNQTKHNKRNKRCCSLLKSKIRYDRTKVS